MSSPIPTIDSKKAVYVSFEELQEAVKSYEKINNFCFRIKGKCLTKMSSGCIMDHQIVMDHFYFNNQNKIEFLTDINIVDIFMISRQFCFN